MKFLLLAALVCPLFPSALSSASANSCNVGNASVCSPQPVVEYNACFTCDSGDTVDAGSCALNPFPTALVWCSDMQSKCEADGGVFTWCYGDACNSCAPRYVTLPSLYFCNTQAGTSALPSTPGLTRALRSSLPTPTTWRRWRAHLSLLSPSRSACLRALADPLADVLQGTEVNIIIITNGDKGCSAAFCLNYTSDQIAATRRVEAVAAAAALGVLSSNVRPPCPVARIA